MLDRWGVPHIYANTPQDAFFAQGWNAARDRLWQIDLWRRSGLGELAEALGPDYTAQDRAIRLFVYRGSLKQEWAMYGVEAKRNTQAFVAGLNAYVTATRRDPSLLPAEFKLAGYKPAFWKPEDVVRVRNHGLAVGVVAQVERARIACQTGSVASADLLYKISPPWTPIVPEGLDVCSLPANVLETYRLAQKPVRLEANEPLAGLGPSIDTVGQGSNNWVISPAKSATGRAILANDPHRALETPSLRYLAHLVAPGLNVIGAGEPALPGIAIGHNETIAFGITVFFIAQEDLYVYETNPLDPNEYRYRGVWEPMRHVRESIRVRGAPNADVDLKFTRHGPVVFEGPAQHRAYAVKATWLDTGGAPYFGSMRYLQAKNLAQFKAALKYWGEPGENQIYADTRGNIGWFPAGFTPLRSNTDGLLPLPGDGRYEWGGYLDRDLLPSAVNPVQGFVATANQMNLPPDYPYRERRVGFFWGDSARFDRISAVLSGLPQVSLTDSERLQNDYLSLPAQRLLHVLGAINVQEPELQDTVRWLTAWDAQVDTKSPQAALFEVWMAHHLGPAVIGRLVPAISEQERSFWGTPMSVVELMESPDDRLGLKPRQARDELMLRSLSEAVKETQQRLGVDRSSWQWGKLSSILFEHPFSGRADQSLRRNMDVGPAPKAGDGSVVGAAVYRPTDFHTVVGASFRMVLDVGHWDDSVVVNTPGQSGDPSSPHYRDLFPLWLEGRYFPLLYSRAAAQRFTERKIVLQPR